MRVLISCSSNDNIDEKYKESSRNVIRFLASEENTLVWGSGNRSIMGIAYEEFDKAKREMLGFTTEKYVDELDSLPNAKHEVMKDTFDLKREMFVNSDLVLVLPGGTGTVSELLTYLEEVRSNDQEKTLIVYDEYGHFNKTIELIEDLIVRKFNNNSIYDYLHVAHNIDEFKTLYDNIKKKNIQLKK